jgi:glycosyltransferase involved in cell wall biosynthesis
MSHKLTVLRFGTYDRGKPRNRIIDSALASAKVRVIEIGFNPWEGIEDKSTIKNPLTVLRIAVNIALGYLRLVARYLQAPAHDVVFVGYPGYIDMLVIRLPAWLRGKPVVFDAFMSVYDTVVIDRGMTSQKSVIAWALRFLDRLSSRAADLTLLDTRAHVRYYVELISPDRSKIDNFPVGAEEIFKPQSYRPGNEKLRVLFFGQFIPLHGIETILRAAKLVEQQPIQFTIVGKGQLSVRISELATELKPGNIDWIEWVDYKKLPDLISQHHVGLGIFGNSRKALSVVPNKVYQIAACESCPVTGDSPAAREFFDEQCAVLVPPADEKALAAALTELAADPEQARRLGRAARKRYEERASVQAIGQQLVELLEHVIK